MAGRLLLDTNVLVLLVAGQTDRGIISKHKNLSSFSVGDFDVLCKTIRPYASVLTTPHVLAEASNLLAQHGEPERTRLLETLRDLITNGLEEEPVSSRSAASRPEFPRIGLTDSGLIQATPPGTTVLTTDLHLYLVLSRMRSDAAINFVHLVYR